MTTAPTSAPGKSLNSKLRSIILLAAAAALVCLVGWILYNYTQRLLHDRLQERLKAITTTAALYISENDIETLRATINEHGRDAIYQDAYRDIFSKLNRIRDTNENIKYVYLLGRGESWEEAVFLADADVNEELELQEDDEGNDFPGEAYDISEFPEMQQGFLSPSVDAELAEDEWGLTISSYAPINENTMLGIDVDVTDYISLVNATFLPFVLFILLLILLLSALTYFLVHMWETRITFMRELDRQKDEVLGIVSHQLATPISALKLSLEMVMEGDYGKVDPVAVEQMNKMQGVVRNLNELVGMILDVSRIQLGRMKVARAPLPLAELFETVLMAIQAKADEHKVKLHIDMPNALPTANLDRRLMHMTLENLLSNAVKYTPSGGDVFFTVKLDADGLFYEVRDTGCGIPKADHKKIFGKLYRASNVNNIDGNGFGLYVAKGAVEAQGGNIAFESEEGKGTTFTVRLPLPTE